MATTVAKIASDNNRIVTVTWAALTEADTGAAVAVAHLRDKCIQVTGTFGGGTFILEGSNDGGVTYAPITDLATVGTAISFTVTGVKSLRENMGLIRPRATAGASASVTISLVGVNLT